MTVSYVTKKMAVALREGPMNLHFGWHVHLFQLFRHLVGRPQYLTIRETFWDWQDYPKKPATKEVD